MRCPQCSFQMSDTAKVCPQCGAPVPVAVPDAEQTASASTPSARTLPSPQPQPMQARPTPTVRQGILSAPENRDYIIAGAGTLLALLAFCFLAFVGVTASGLSGLVNASASVTGLAATAGSELTIASGLGNQLGVGGMLWLVPACALVGLGVAALLTYRSTVSAAPPPRAGALVLAGAGLLGVLVLILFAIGFLRQVSSLESSINGPGSPISGLPLGGLGSADVLSLSASLDPGYWLSLIGLAVIALAGIHAWLSARREIPTATFA